MINLNFDDNNEAMGIESNIQKMSIDYHCHVKKDNNKRNVTVWRKLITVLIMCIF